MTHVFLTSLQFLRSIGGKENRFVEPLVRRKPTFSSTLVNHFLDWIDCFLWLYWLSLLIVLNLSFDFTETPSPQRNYSEPSLSQRRRLAKSITSPRQLVESKGTLQSIHTWGSEIPQKHFTVWALAWALFSFTPILRRVFYCHLRAFLWHHRNGFKIICGFWVWEFENLPYFCKFEGSVDYKNHWCLVLSYR